MVAWLQLVNVFLPTSIRLHSQNVFRDATNKYKENTGSDTDAIATLTQKEIGKI